MLKESPRKVIRDHASLAAGQKWSTVLYSTPQPLASDMKTNYDNWMLTGFNWFALMLYDVV